jgi:hypothetical protein
LRPSHVGFICGTLPSGTLTICIPNLFPQKEKHNVGLLRFDDDHDHIYYRFAQVRIFGGKSNVFRSLQCGGETPVIMLISTALLLDSIVCSTKNSLAASHDKNEVCLSTRCEMNY